MGEQIWTFWFQILILINFFSNRYISLPKYNNYVFNDKKFDKFTKMLVPKSLLDNVPKGHFENFLSNHAILSYMIFKEVGDLMPHSYHESVVHRWGSELIVGSPVLSVNLLLSNSGSNNISKSILLPEPILLQIWLNSKYVSERSNPQCVYWMHNDE